MYHDELDISISALLALTDVSKGDSVRIYILNNTNVSSVNIVFTAAPVLPWYSPCSPSRSEEKSTWATAPV